MVVPGHARDRDDGRRSAWIAAVPPLMIGVGWCLRQFRQTRRVARRLRTEQRVLRRSEEQFRSLVANATDVIVIHEADGTIRYQSPAA